MFPMRDGVPPEMGLKGIDLAALAALAEAISIEFTGIKYEWVMLDNGMIQFQWWAPLIPFVRFKMPFTLQNLESLHETIGTAIADTKMMQERET